MSYVGFTGGESAIQGASEAMDYLRTRGEDPLSCTAIRHQLWALQGRVLSEGGFYDPDLASLAIKQTGGDSLEAAMTLRSHRTTLPRLSGLPVQDSGAMRCIRRISAAFKDIPGGQFLGPTPDYAHRLFRYELLDEDRRVFKQRAASLFTGLELEEAAIPDSFPKVVDELRQQGMLPEAGPRTASTAFDVTSEPLIFPVNRSAVLGTMTRAETGGLLALAYSTMRGYGDVHPTVAELRVGYVPVRAPHPLTGKDMVIGECLMTECEVVAMFHASDDPDAPPYFTLGYGACFGHNEVKAIAMAILDRSLEDGRQHGVRHPCQDQEFVLLHVDGIASMGFCTHYKMPHYVTFMSDMDRLRRAQEKGPVRQAVAATADNGVSV